MGDYADITAVKSRVPSSTLIRLTNDDASSATIVDAPITAAIEEAESEINGYLAGRYDLPADVSRNPILKTFTVTIAVWYLYQRRPSADADTTQKDAYEKAIAFLQGLAEKKFHLDVEPGPDESDVTGIDLPPPRFAGTARTLSHDAWKDW